MAKNIKDYLIKQLNECEAKIIKMHPLALRDKNVAEELHELFYKMNELNKQIKKVGE